MSSSVPTTSWWKNSGDPARVVFSEAASSKWSQSFFIPTVFSLIIVLSAFAFPDTFVYGISLHWADVIASAAAFLVFSTARVLQRNKQMQNYRGLRLWLISGFCADISPQIVLVLITGKFSLEYIATSLIGLIAYPLLMTLVGVVLAGRFNSRNRIRELNRQKAQLLLIRDTLDDEIVTVQSELSQMIHSRLSTVFSEITTNFTSENADAVKKSAAALREAIDVVVRPLSKELAFEQQALSTSAQHFKDKDQYLTDYLSRRVRRSSGESIQLRQILSPLLTLLISMVFILPAMLTVYGPMPSLRSSGVLILLGTLMAIIRNRAGSVKMASIVALILPTGLAGLVSFAISSAFWGFQTLSEGPVAVTLSFSLVTFATTSFLYVTARRKSVVEQSEQTNQAIELLLSRLRQEVWVIRRELARLVHGQVQSRLLAAAMRLSKIAQPTSEDISLAQADVMAAISSVATGLNEEEESFTSQYSRIVDAWDGVCDITLHAEQTLTTLIEKDRIARTCVAEVIGEAVANAAKHSEAAAVSVTLNTDVEGYVTVTITTTGDLDKTEAAQSGYGSRIFDELTTSWERTSAEGVITLKALIALDPALN